MTPELVLALVAFAFVTSITPGPNNLMLLASGAAFGFRRSVPHMLGVGIGFVAMTVLVGLGLAGLIEAAPGLRLALKAAGVAYMLWFAWKILNAGAPGEAGAAARPMRFHEAALFQWVNPKAWAMALTAVTAYAPGGTLPAMADGGGDLRAGQHPLGRQLDAARAGDAALPDQRPAAAGVQRDDGGTARRLALAGARALTRRPGSRSLAGAATAGRMRCGVLAAIVWALGAPALAQDFDAAVRELFGDDPARYRAVVEGFQAAVRAGDGAAAAALRRLSDRGRGRRRGADRARRGRLRGALRGDRDAGDRRGGGGRAAGRHDGQLPGGDARAGRGLGVRGLRRRRLRRPGGEGDRDPAGRRGDGAGGRRGQGVPRLAGRLRQPARLHRARAAARGRQRRLRGGAAGGRGGGGAGGRRWCWSIPRGRGDDAGGGRGQGAVRAAGAAGRGRRRLGAGGGAGGGACGADPGDARRATGWSSGSGRPSRSRCRCAGRRRRC